MCSSFEDIYLLVSVFDGRVRVMAGSLYVPPPIRYLPLSVCGTKIGTFVPYIIYLTYLRHYLSTVL